MGAAQPYRGRSTVLGAPDEFPWNFQNTTTREPTAKFTSKHRRRSFQSYEKKGLEEFEDVSTATLARDNVSLRVTRFRNVSTEVGTRSTPRAECQLRWRRNVPLAAGSVKRLNSGNMSYKALDGMTPVRVTVGQTQWPVNNLQPL